MEQFCQGEFGERSKPFRSFDYTDIKESITRIFLYFQGFSNLRNCFIIGVIRETWDFSEIFLTFRKNPFNIAKIYFY
jgi:hypothetical protein